MAHYGEYRVHIFHEEEARCLEMTGKVGRIVRNLLMMRARVHCLVRLTPLGRKFSGERDILRLMAWVCLVGLRGMSEDEDV